LKTVIILSPDAIDDNFLKFLEGEKIEFVQVGKTELYPINEQVVTTSLQIIANESSHPVMLVCKSGRALTGVVVACLRKLQKWSMTSIFEEYRRYSGGSRLQPQQEQFIEIYDIDLITISPSAPDYLQR
jgi:tyrosine-protein phosphatase OCA1